MKTKIRTRALNYEKKAHHEYFESCIGPAGNILGVELDAKHIIQWNSEDGDYATIHVAGRNGIEIADAIMRLLRHKYPWPSAVQRAAPTPS